ncbi:MAG: hypothetical protein AABX51_04870 [Nanoarchaeota archaeon]
MKQLLLVLLLITIPIAQAQVVLDFTMPELKEITLKETEQGIFCDAKTNDGSWPIFIWSINGVETKENEPLLSSGYAKGDRVRCTVSATNGYLNDTNFKEIVPGQISVPGITGAVIGNATSSTSVPWLLAGLFGGILLVLAYVNLRLYRRIKS